MSNHLKRFRAFISYSQKDKAHARRIHQALESYRLPRGVEVDGVDDKSRKLGRLFRDDDEMGAATDLGVALRGAIADAENLIVVCSPHAARSHWVNEEVIHFKRTGRADRIFAVIVDGEPSANVQERECFPPALRLEIGPDGALTQEPAEPFGLDVRKESFNRVVVRLAAGVVRTPFDALWRREQRRAMATATTRVFLLAVVVAALGVAINQNLWRPELDRYRHYTRFVHPKSELAVAAPGATFQDCEQGSTDCPVMVVIPEGAFMMRDAPWQMGINELGASQPAPQGSRISIARFAVSQREVSFSDWRACIRGGGCDGYLPDRSGWDGDNLPVINVTWDDAQNYVAWLSRTTGQHYRLLTFAEWEYAARGVTSADDPRNEDAWSFGNDASQLPLHAWFSENSHGQPHPVGTALANPFGLNDMHGNVWEWVEDCYEFGRPEQMGRASAGTVSSPEVRCSNRLLRGGSWSTNASSVSSESWISTGHMLRNFDFGFRVARTL